MARRSWEAVRELRPVRASSSAEIRLQIVQSRQGFGLKLSGKHMTSIVVNADKLDRMIVSLDHALTCIRDMDKGRSDSESAA